MKKNAERKEKAKVSEFQTIHEIVKAARRNLSQGAWDYLTGGCETETTLKRNRHAIDSIAFRPRVLRDVTTIDTSTTLLGMNMRLPVVMAPMGSLNLLDAGGAMGVAEAAEQFGVVSILSSVTEPGLEEIAAATSHDKVYQLYVRGDNDWVDDFIRRAIDCDYRAFCLTVDTAIYSRRERDLIKRYQPTARRAADGHNFQSSMTWDLVRHIKEKFDIPMILKGIATAEDALMALDHGIEVIYVSNHGGRQLDHGRGSIEVLSEVVEAVGGRAEVMVDGGFLRGTDIVKAIALGARAVGLGKVQGFGLAADGAAGVVRLLEILEHEIKGCMALLGVTALDQLSRAHLHGPVVPMNQPHALGGFPFIELPELGY
jgi:isopentenyl diphosphate isomerase/L-lactate dehydrogenase-like FMN-dependent dehydrogenase